MSMPFMFVELPGQNSNSLPLVLATWRFERRAGNPGRFGATWGRPHEQTLPYKDPLKIGTAAFDCGHSLTLI